jgi:hypothetical protein
MSNGESDSDLSDDDAKAVELLKALLDTVDAIPSTLIEASETLRQTAPDLFEKMLVHGVQVVGFAFAPTTATEFLEVLQPNCSTRYSAGVSVRCGIIVNNCSISCRSSRNCFAYRDHWWMHASYRNYRSDGGATLSLRSVPGREGNCDVEWIAGDRNGPFGHGS